MFSLQNKMYGGSGDAAFVVVYYNTLLNFVILKCEVQHF